jgi:GDPmannose 4,6-dehydratase
VRALILGVLGQDGSYLAEQLLADGYEVFGLTRRTHGVSPARLITGDLLDQDSLERALRESRPDEVYNLAAVTAPGGGWGTAQPPLLAEVTAVGVVKLFDAMLKAAPRARLVHASSSAVFSPQWYGLYGVSKRFAHDAVIGYRSSLSASNAVLFSHTSPRQDPRFLARRICSTIARIAAGGDERLQLTDPEARRDWGFSPDYCEALRAIARHDSAGDWVIATGASHSVRDMTEAALRHAGLSWDEAVVVHPGRRMPRETTAHEQRIATAHALGWAPRTTFDDMVRQLMEASHG